MDERQQFGWESDSVEYWYDLAQNSRKAAGVLVKMGYYRFAISRAYYAVYSKVTNDLMDSGISMPSGREGPAHIKLRTIIKINLISMNREKRLALSRMIGRLYDLRVVADYSPSTTVEARDGREAFGLMDKVFNDF